MVQTYFATLKETHQSNYDNLAGGNSFKFIFRYLVCLGYFKHWLFSNNDGNLWPGNLTSRSKIEVRAEIFAWTWCKPRLSCPMFHSRTSKNTRQYDIWHKGISLSLLKNRSFDCIWISNLVFLFYYHSNYKHILPTNMWWDLFWKKIRSIYTIYPKVVLTCCHAINFSNKYTITVRIYKCGVLRIWI